MKKVLFILLLLSVNLFPQKLTTSAPTRLDLSHYYTDDLHIEIAVLDDSGDGFDFTGYTGTFNLKRDESTSAALKSFSVSFTDSIIVIDIDADSLTFLRAPRLLYYSLLLTYSGAPKTWLAGKFDYSVRPSDSQISSLTLAYSTTDLSLTIYGVSTFKDVLSDSLDYIRDSIDTRMLYKDSTGTYFTKFQGDTVKADVNQNAADIDALEQVITNVIGYGAIGDGVTDSYLALNSALQSGTTIIIGNSIRDTFVVSQPLFPDSNQTLIINGVIKVKDSQSATLTENATSGNSTVVVADATGFKAGDYVIISDDLQNVQGGGVNTRLTGNARIISGVEGTTITLTEALLNNFLVSENAFIATQPSAIIVSKNNVTIKGRGGVNANKANQPDIQPTTDGGTTEPVEWGGGIVVLNANNFRLEDIYIKNAILHNLNIRYSDSIYINNINVTDAHDKNVLIRDASYGTVSNCFFINADHEDGLQFYDNNHDWQIINNVFYNNGRFGLSILHGNCYNFQTVGNRMIDNGTNLYIRGRNISVYGDKLLGGGKFRYNSYYGSLKIEYGNDVNLYGVQVDSSLSENILITGASKNVNFYGGHSRGTYTSSQNGYGVKIDTVGGYISDGVTFSNMVFKNLNYGFYLDHSLLNIKFNDCSITNIKFADSLSTYLQRADTRPDTIEVYNPVLQEHDNFEDGTVDGWTASGGLASVDVTTEEIFEGEYSLKLVNTQGSYGNAKKTFTGLLPGRRYRIDVHGYRSSDGIPAGSMVLIRAGSTADGLDYGYIKTLHNEVWIHGTCEFTATGTDLYLQLRPTDGVSGSTAYFDNISLSAIYGGINVNGDVSASGFKINGLQTPPASATATGTAGTIIIGSDGYLYLCTATDTWVRVQLTTWE
jgi:hypothetical protein